MRVDISIIFILIGLYSYTNQEVAPWQSEFVQVSEEGILTYTPDDQGNIIPDFSSVGYHQGNLEIPEVPVRIELSPPVSGSSQELIQDAINELSNESLDENGFRGAILLKNGDYYIPGSLQIRASGIVLRGEGDNEKGGTRLIATGNSKRSLLIVDGAGQRRVLKNSKKQITDAFVPVGAKAFSVNSTDGLDVGDKIIIYRPGTANWINDLRMDQIVEREGTKQWHPEEYNLSFERVIIAIERNKIFIDNPVVMPMEEKYGGGEIYKYSFDGRIDEVGIEKIFFESVFENDSAENHAWDAVEMGRIENGWIRNVTSQYFGNACVNLRSASRQITVMDSRSLDPKSIITGGRRYSFNNDGQLNLFKDLYASEGRHDFVTGARVPGPNVFLNCVARNTHADIGPHHRWAVGTLYDNIDTDGAINVQDRGYMGTGHGWSGVTQVIWNCKAKEAAVQNPWVSGKNYCIGLQGQKYAGWKTDRMDGEWEGNNQSGLMPGSLYRAQFEARKRMENSEGNLK